MEKLKTILLLMLSMVSATVATGQWTTSGNDIYNSNSGNVGIGIAPTMPLTVKTNTGGYGIYVVGNTYGQASHFKADGLVMADGSVFGAHSVFYNAGNNTYFDTPDGHYFRAGSTYGYPYLLMMQASADINSLFRGVASAKTATGTVLSAINAGNTYNTTAGSLKAYGGSFVSTATRSSGGNDLVNVGLYASASGAQKNYAAIFDQGSVGIGITSVPDGYKLAVAGNIITEKVRVKLQSAGWPDYVFHSQYKLPTLKEVEQYINEHKHLPEVPSAAQVEKEGVDLGDNQALLLKKIEELTLHLIEMNKRIDRLSEENEIMKKKLEEKK